MTLDDYWDALQNSLTAFATNNKIKPKDDADNEAYMKQKTFLELLVTLGKGLEAASFFSKKKKSQELKALPLKTFGSEKIVTTFAGPLSLAFAEQVYLRHVRNFKDVTIDDQDFFVQTLVDLPQEKNEVHSLAEKLDAAITAYKKTVSDLVALNLFPPAEKVLPLPVEDKHLSTPL